jgi:hypothetical protein
MYILTKAADKGDGYTIHGLTGSDRECDLWQAMGGIVFDINELDNASFDAYGPLQGPNDEEATDE